MIPNGEARLIRRLRHAATILIPPIGLILLIIVGNAFARVFLAPELVSVIAAIALISLAVTLIASRKPIAIPSVIRALALLWLAMAISTLFARNKIYAAEETVLWGCVLVIFWTVTFMDARRIEPIIFAVLAAYATFALLQVAWMLLQGTSTEILRPLAMTPNPNNLGAAMLPAIALALWRKRWYWLGVFVIALVLSGSRAALGGLVIGTAVYALYHINQRSTIPRVVWIIGAVGLLVIIPIIILQLSHSTHGNLALRWDIWHAALLAFRDSPIIGIGPQNFELAFLQYKQMIHETVQPHAHMIYLQVAAELGILGLIALGVVAYVLVRRIITIWRGGDTQRAAILAALFAALAVQGSLEFVYWVAASTWIVMLAGWALASTPSGSVPEAPAREMNHRVQIDTAGMWIAGAALMLLPLTMFQPTVIGLALAFGFYNITLRSS